MSTPSIVSSLSSPSPPQPVSSPQPPSSPPAPSPSTSTAPSGTLTAPEPSTEPSQSSVSAPITKTCNNNIINQKIRNSKIRNDVNSAGRLINIRQILEDIIKFLQVHNTNNNVNDNLTNIENLKKEYINIYKNVYCKDESGRTLPNNNNNNCKTKKQLNNLNSYFTKIEPENKNETENKKQLIKLNSYFTKNEPENKNETENKKNKPYNNKTFLKNIKTYKQLGLRINNSSKVKVYSSVYNKELKNFTDKHKTTLLKLECLLKNVNNELFDLKRAKDSSTKLLAYKLNNTTNNNFTKLKTLKNTHTQYKQQTQKQRKQKISKFFSKIKNSFGKKSNNYQSLIQESPNIKYNNKAHKKLKNEKYNKLRKEIIDKFLEDINKLYPNND